MRLQDVLDKGAELTALMTALINQYYAEQREGDAGRVLHVRLVVTKHMELLQQTVRPDPPRPQPEPVAPPVIEEPEVEVIDPPVLVELVDPPVVEEPEPDDEAVYTPRSRRRR